MNEINPVPITTILDKLVGNIEENLMPEERVGPTKSLILPCDISYTEDSILLFNTKRRTANPRYAFALALNCFEIQHNWFYETESSRIHVSTELDKHLVHFGQFSVVGGVGFGFATSRNGEHIRIPHLGHVRIGRHVSIGSNTCIDRAVIGETYIGTGTKIDNLVHVAHNCKIGDDVLICAGAVLCGSVEVGDGAFIGAGAVIKNKVKIGKKAIIGAGAVVVKDVEEGQTVKGNPAK